MDEKQDTGDFRIEYQFQPSPEGSQRLSTALDLVLALLLEDLRQHPTSPSQPTQGDGNR